MRSLWEQEETLELLTWRSRFWGLVMELWAKKSSMTSSWNRKIFNFQSFFCIFFPFFCTYRRFSKIYPNLPPNSTKKYHQTEKTPKIIILDPHFFHLWRPPNSWFWPPKMPFFAILQNPPVPPGQMTSPISWFLTPRFHHFIPNKGKTPILGPQNDQFFEIVKFSTSRKWHFCDFFDFGTFQQFSEISKI